jgi:Arc/MetJ-type ribon-helix-helix transcriptional regulator
MDRRRVNIVLDDELAMHIDRRIERDGGFKSADDYVGELIRRDMQDDAEAAAFLNDLLSEALLDGEQHYRSVSAEDIIGRSRNS